MPADWGAYDRTTSSRSRWDMYDKLSASPDVTAARGQAKPGKLQDVVGDVLRFYGNRVGATAAEMYDPLIAAVSGQRDPSMGPELSRVALGQALITGKRMFGGPQTAAGELRQAGFKQSPVPEFLGEIPGGYGAPFKVARALTGPTAAGFALEAPVANVLNEVGGAFVGPAARGLANLEVGGFRTRAAVGPVIEAFKRGSSLPNAIRDEFYRTLRTAEGNADWRAFLRQKSLGEHASLPESVQERIGHAVETKTIGSLAPKEQAVANALVKEYASIPKARRAVGGRAHELAQSSRLGYITRIHKDRGVYGEPPVPPPALGTNPGQARTELGRELTSRQMGGNYEPAVKAALIHGARADTRIMHMDIVNRLANKFGHAAGPGEETIASIRGIPTGFSPAMQAKLEATALPKPLHQTLQRLNERLAPEQWGRFSQFVRETNQIFKSTALFSPGFVSRNIQNNIFQTALFGNMDPRTWTYAAKVLGGAGGPEDAAFLELAIKNGVIGRGQIAQETGSALTRGGGRVRTALTAPFRGVRTANTAAEDLSRLSFFKYQLDHGLSPAAAAQKVDDVLINYSPRFAGKGMAWARRNAFPFINWTVNAPQIFVRSALERPGSLGMLGNARERQIEAHGGRQALAALPDYMRQQGVVPLGGNKFLNPQGYGSFDVNELVGAATQNRPGQGGPLTGVGDEILNRAYPQYSIPVALYTGKDPFTGYPIKGVKGWAKFLSGKVPATKIPVLAWDLAHNKKGAKERAISFASGVRTVQR